jgi:hypothetical protein
VVEPDAFEAGGGVAVEEEERVPYGRAVSCIA